METTDVAQSQGINFVYFYNDYGSKEQAACKDLHIASIQKTHPGAQVIETGYECPVEHVMLYRAAVYAKIRRQVRGNILFLDTDVIVAKPLTDVVWEEWDLALVPGRKVDPYLIMPYCGGMIFSRDTPEAQAWFDLTFKSANSLPQGMITNGWWVDQLGMAWAAEHTPNLKVVVADPDLYNYVPEIEAPTDAFLVHLKGPRKHMMPYYLNEAKEQFNGIRLD